jgi:hypothetical protein
MILSVPDNGSPGTLNTRLNVVRPKDAGKVGLAVAQIHLAWSLVSTPCAAVLQVVQKKCVSQSAAETHDPELFHCEDVPLTMFIDPAHAFPASKRLTNKIIQFFIFF